MACKMPVYTCLMQAAISLLSPKNILKRFRHGFIRGKQGSLIITETRLVNEDDNPSSPSEWAILLIPSTFNTPRLIKKTTNSVITTFHESKPKDQIWKQRGHALQGSKKASYIQLLCILLVFSLWTMILVLGRRNHNPNHLNIHFQEKKSSYMFVDQPLDGNCGSLGALRGLGIVFSKGNRAMENLIVANLEEGCSLSDFRLFLRTLYRSGVMANADLVLLFPWPTTIPQTIRKIISEEDKSFRRLLHFSSGRSTAKRSSNAGPGISVFDPAAFKMSEDLMASASQESKNFKSNITWNRVHVMSTSRGDNCKRSSSFIACTVTGDVASSTQGHHYKHPFDQFENGEVKRRPIVWGNAGNIASAYKEDKGFSIRYANHHVAPTHGCKKSSSIRQDHGDIEFSFGSVIGFQINELDSIDGFSGFFVDPISRLRRWLCYQMLLGLLKTKFEQVMLVELGGVVILGDVFTAHQKRKDFLYLTTGDSTWEESILQPPIYGNEKIREASLQGNSLQTKGTPMMRKTLYHDEAMDKAINLYHFLNKNATSSKNASSTRVAGTMKEGKDQTMFETLYGKELWKSLDKREKEQSIVSSRVILGSMRATKGLVNSMVLEVVRIAMRNLKENSMVQFPDEVLLSYLVQKCPHLLGKTVAENLEVFSNKESMTHCLDGSKQEHVFQRSRDQQRYSILQASSLNISLYQGSPLDIARLIMYDICSSPISSSVYDDCSQYK